LLWHRSEPPPPSQRPVLHLDGAIVEIDAPNVDLQELEALFAALGRVEES
jgi:hypothetical protein